MKNYQVRLFLRDIENTYTDNEYINVVGINTAMLQFINWCKKQNIWTYRVYPFCTYQGISYKGIFCKKDDLQIIKKYVDKKFGLCLNASNPFL